MPCMLGLHRVLGRSLLGLLPAEGSSIITIMAVNLLLRSEDEAVIWRGSLVSAAIRQL
jgi:Mrp family chromosome partitioning ATPase